MNVREASSELELSYQRALSTMEERYSTIIEQINLIIFDLNLESNDIYISDNFPKQVGTEFNEKPILKQIIDIKTVHPDDAQKFKHYLRQGRTGILSDSLTYRRRKQDGMYAWIRSSRKNIFNKDGKLIRVLGTAQDVSAEMEVYEVLKTRAENDALTGIHNLIKFSIEAQEILIKNIDKTYAIIVFDIDKFRIINDLYGSEEGDRVLKFIGDILKDNISETYLYCRMYADNFAILMEYKNDTDFALLAITLSEEITKYPIGLELILSLGVCKVDDHDIAVTTLCDRASLAKKTVKGNVVQLLAFYDEAMRERDIEDKVIENEMTLALENDEFTMYLQPKVSIESTEVVGAEALARWIHPLKGVITPARFIPLFEKNEFIVKLDYYIWEKAFSTISKWIDEGHKPVPISVNVSRLHLYNSNLVECFVKLAEKYQVPKNLIELELTETAFFDNLDVICRLVYDLKREGFVLSMDDFGSGYSSLNMLKDIPVDIIKFDSGFMSEVVETERGKAVIQYTIAMARKLNIEVVAEGVETFEQAKFLYEAGCDTAQGYFYSKPLPIKKFEQYTYGFVNEFNI